MLPLSMAQWQNGGIALARKPSLVNGNPGLSGFGNRLCYTSGSLVARSVSVSVSDIGKNDWKTVQTRSCDGADYAAPIPSRLYADEMFNTSVYAVMFVMTVDETSFVYED